MLENGESKSPFFRRWEVVIALVALVLSCLSLGQDIFQTYTNSSANVQLDGVVRGKGSYLFSSDLKGRDTLRIVATATIRNRGRATAVLVNIEWAPVWAPTSRKPGDAWIGISDSISPNQLTQTDYETFFRRRDSPLLGVSNKHIAPGEVKHLLIYFEGSTDLPHPEDRERPSVKVTLQFSDGKPLVLFPEMEYSSGSGW